MITITRNSDRKQWGDSQEDLGKLYKEFVPMANQSLCIFEIAFADGAIRLKQYDTFDGHLILSIPLSPKLYTLTFDGYISVESVRKEIQMRLKVAKSRKTEFRKGAAFALEFLSKALGINLEDKP